MTINDRISDLIYQLQMNPNSFADTIGVKSTVIYNIVKGRRSKPSYQLLLKMLLTFNTINANWLLQGEGNTWKQEEDFDLKRAQRYESIHKRIKELVLQINEKQHDEPAMEELSELLDFLLSENIKQKKKIESLYKKYDNVLGVVRSKLILGRKV